MRKDGRSRAAGIVRTLAARIARRERGTAAAVGPAPSEVAVRVGTFQGRARDNRAAAVSAARPKPAKAAKRAKPKPVPVKPKAPPKPTAPHAPRPRRLPRLRRPCRAGRWSACPTSRNGPVNGVRVVGTGSDSRALVHLAAGCTGTLSFDIRVTSGGGDGVKVHADAGFIALATRHFGMRLPLAAVGARSCSCSLI